MIAWLKKGIRLPLAAGVIVLIVYPLAFGNPYDMRVLTISGIYALLVIGFQFIFGHAGAVSLAQATFFGLGGYVTGILATELGWSFPITFPLSVMGPAIVAAVVAAPVLKLESHYFALATLGIALVMLLIAINWESVTGGANGIPAVPHIRIVHLEIGRGLPLLVFVWGMVLLGGLLAWQMMRGLYGHAFRIMRENGTAAMSIGINVGGLRFVAFVLSAAYGGAAGALDAHANRVVSPESLEFPVMVVALSMAVIGGRTRVAGAVLAAVILVHLPEWFRFLERYYLIAYGACVLTMVVVAPYGMIGALERLRSRILPEAAPAAPTAVSPATVPRREVSAGTPLLEVKGLTKAFGGVRAVDNVDFVLRQGQILGLIGPNGSGKTTLINMITGIYTPDAGEVRLCGKKITGLPSHVIANHGIARTFQHVHLIDDMTALDNVAVARTNAEGVGLWSALSTLRTDDRLIRARTNGMALLNDLGVGDVALRESVGLPYGTRRRVEIARALATDPQLLLLDEPAAGLNEAEQVDLARRLRDMVDRGISVLVIEHNMPFLMELADHVICLDYGQVMAEGTPDEIRVDGKVIEAYLGTPDECGV